MTPLTTRAITPTMATATIRPSPSASAGVGAGAVAGTVVAAFMAAVASMVDAVKKISF